MKYFLFLMLFVSAISCKRKSDLSKDFSCSSKSFTNLSSLTDFKKNFTIKLPKKWKTNYYYDSSVSSIYSADTTKSLTQTTLIDATFVTNIAEIDDAFIDKIKNDNKKMNLKEIISKKTIFINKPTYYNLSKGKKSAFDYRILNIFVKANMGFLHLKTEVYGNSSVNERLCKAIDLFEEIELN